MLSCLLFFFFLCLFRQHCLIPSSYTVYGDVATSSECTERSLVWNIRKISWVLCSGWDEYTNRFFHRWRARWCGSAGTVIVVVTFLIRWFTGTIAFIFCLFWPMLICSWLLYLMGWDQQYKCLIWLCLTNIDIQKLEGRNCHWIKKVEKVAKIWRDGNVVREAIRELP